LNKFETSLPKDDSHKISMHSDQWFMRRFLKMIKISLFGPLLGPKRGQPLYLNKSESPSLKHDSFQVWLKLAKWFLRRSRLKEKLTGADDGRIVLSIARLSRRLRWANKKRKLTNFAQTWYV